jgi:hypothetical protein
VSDALDETVDKAVIKPHVFYDILHKAPKSACYKRMGLEQASLLAIHLEHNEYNNCQRYSCKPANIRSDSMLFSRLSFV